VQLHRPGVALCWRPGEAISSSHQIVGRRVGRIRVYSAITGEGNLSRPGAVSNTALSPAFSRRGDLYSSSAES
jgi:hypothetical protein